MASDKGNNMSVFPAILGAGASLIGGYINNQYAKQRADEQWQRTLYMQDKMNAYNAPVAQMQRLEQAGLNPNLVYGHGGAVIESAGGNAPQPPQSAPIDTQGVLQMVQAIVGAMLEKDKIQANKEMQSQQIQSNEKIAEEHNATQIDVTEMQNKSTERNVDVTTSSNQSIASERNKTEKEIADENRKENRRQFDLDYAHRVSVDNARISIDRSLANSTIALHSSQIKVNELSSALADAVQPYLTNKAKYESLSLAFSYGNDMLNHFLSLPQYIGEGELGRVFDNAGLPRPAGYQLQTIAEFHNMQFDLWKKIGEANFERADAAAWYAGWNAFCSAASTPIQLGISAASIK